MELINIEKHSDMCHGSKNRYIELFAVVKDGGHLVRFRVVAKEGDKNSGEFKVGAFTSTETALVKNKNNNNVYKHI